MIKCKYDFFRHKGEKMAKIFTVASGKGGVGKSTFCANIALSLEKLNKKSKKIVMTDKGQVLIAQKIKPLVDMEDRVLDSWTEEDRLKYLELIEKFKEQFEEEVKAYDKRQ